MECLQIDWKNIDARYERDEFYENIQAPKWMDFTAPLQPVDDHEWFCGKAGCTHVKESLWQPPDNPLPTDPQETLPFQASKKGAPLAESKMSGCGAGKRGRGTVVSSSYSSVSSIKEAYAKHKSLHITKMSAITESSCKQHIKRAVLASENQNPNEACEVQSGHSKAPVFKASDILAKKPKMTENMHLSGKSENSALSAQMKTSQCRSGLDVTKPRVSIGKDLALRKSTTSRLNAKEQDTAMSNFSCNTSDPKNRKADTTRMPFSVFTTSRSAMTSSLSFPSKRRMGPARSIQNVRLENEKSATCRLARVVVRKDHKIVDEQVPMPNKQKSAENLAISDQGPRNHGLSHVKSEADELNLQSEHPVEEHDAASIMCDRHPSHICREEDQENAEAVHVSPMEDEQVAQVTLEQRLENLCLSTPGIKPKQVLRGDEDLMEKKEMFQEQEEMVSYSHIDESYHAIAAVKHRMVPSMCRVDHSLHLNNAAEHEDVLTVTDHDHNEHFAVCPSQQSEGRSIKHVIHANGEDSQMSESFIGSTDVPEEHEYAFITNKQSENKDNQPPPLLKDWQRTRGLKRKSSELNFKVNCSAKDHGHENQKVTSSAAFGSSLLCQQAEQVSASRSPMKAPPSISCHDSCREQHKKMKTTKVQPFKPFRLRTEERGALKGLGLGKKEETSNPKELIHHALRMPSFGHPFRPQRSTKKLTIPKEPNFHSSRARKACTASHHAPMLA